MKNVILFISLFFGIHSYSQESLGQWKDYLSYHSVIDIVEADEFIYAACQNSIFSYNREDNSMTRYSSVNGLSDKGISSIQWNEENKTLMIGYENGNIDFLTPNGVINFSDIKRSTITSGKKINELYNDGDNVWVSTDFGIVKINIPNVEVVETYMVGEDGSPMGVTSVEVVDTIVYASTENGILKASINTALQDFNNWTLIDDLPFGNYDMVKVLGDNLVTFFKEDTERIIYRYDGVNWTVQLDDSSIEKIRAVNNRLLILRYNWVRVVDNEFNTVKDVSDYSFTDSESFFTGYVDSNDKVWIGDRNWGLVTHLGANDFEYYQPESPFSNSIWRVDAVGNQLWIAHGSLNAVASHTNSRDYFSGRNNGSWEIYGWNNQLNQEGVLDILAVAIDPLDVSRTFFGSWNGGLIEKKTNGDLGIYHEGMNNSIIHNNGQEDSYRVAGLDFDRNGNLWMTNSNNENQEQIIVRKRDGSEVSFDCNLDNSLKIGDLIHTSNNQIWGININSTNSRLFVYDYNGTIDNKNDDRTKRINTNENNGGLPTNSVLCVAEDLDGEIWIGTTEGPAIIYTPEFLFDGNPPQAQQIKIEQDGNVELVLSTSSITSIAIDGANRKWLGTQSSGVFLLSEDGTKEIYHFTTDNSPLMDNHIKDIAIDDKTGEVFFATTEGMVSFVGDATLGLLDNECYSVFPNPVRPGYFGPIAIDGLARDSDVKITDVAGNLVFQTESKGGRAVWYGNNFSGQRVQSGVYLALITSIEDDRETSCIAKIMIVN